MSYINKNHLTVYSLFWAIYANEKYLIGILAVGSFTSYNLHHLLKSRNISEVFCKHNETTYVYHFESWSA